jgi:hypothetical protein
MKTGSVPTRQEALLVLAKRVQRLLPCWRDPEKFFEARSEVVAELRRLAVRHANRGEPES